MPAAVRKCSHPGCLKRGYLALYELMDDMTKVWRTNLCDEHENLIAKHNAELKRVHNIKEFKER